MNRKTYDDSVAAMAASKNFLKDKYRPKACTVRIRTLKHPSDLKSYEGVTIILVKSGRGTIVVNDEKIELNEGTCIVLHFFCFFKLIPDPQEYLEILECYAPTANYHFAMMIPGSTIRSFETSSGYVECILRGKNYERALARLNDMYQCKNLELQNIYFYELLGHIESGMQ